MPTAHLLRNTETQESPRSAARFGSVPANTEDEHRFVQLRLACFGGAVASIAGLFAAVGTAEYLIAGRPYFTDPSRPAHLAGTACALSLWLLARGQRTFSPAVLLWLDAGATLAMCWSFAAMGHALPGGIGSLIGLLAVSYVVLSRAATVPSTKERTLVLSSLSFGALLASTAMKTFDTRSFTTTTDALLSLLDPSLWCLSGVGLATTVSTIIYGLKERVRKARQLGQYTLEAKIGEGGMGQIYRACHAMLRRPTAIKLMSGPHSEEHLRRFEREVRMTASLTHPNTICVFDYGRTPDGVFYYAMELLDGQNLQTLIDEHGPQPAARVVHILLQVCGALAEAHDAGLIHRDIKPANIHLCRHGGSDDFVKVLDFGLVRMQSGVDASYGDTHEIVGTPLYMAPEAIVSPDRIDARADLYGLGATAYHLLTGSAPFSGATAIEVCGHHLHTKPEPPSRRSPLPIPGSLERIVLSCLEKDPAARPASSEDLARLLRDIEGLPTWTQEDARRARTNAARAPEAVRGPIPVTPRAAWPARDSVVRRTSAERRV